MVLSLPDGLFRLVAQKMLAIDPKVRTSMWWDMAAGRHTEIDFLNQKVVEEAEKLNWLREKNGRLMKIRERIEFEEKLLKLGVEIPWNK